MIRVTFEPSPAEFAADLASAEAALDGRMKEASELAATRSAAAMRRRYRSRYTRISGDAVGSIGSVGPRVAFGGSSVPYMLGQNFGSARYRQFPRQTNPDYFAFSAVRAETKSIVSVYDKQALEAMEKAF